MPKTSTELTVPAEHPCYADHFPGDPLVPGALLLQWIEDRLREQWPRMTIREVRSAKFLHAVRPGRTCQLHCEYKAEKHAVTVDCRCGSQTVCKVHFIVTGECS